MRLRRVAKKAITHKLKAERRKALTVIDISITVRGEQHAIKVLRPVHGRDALWVEYCDTTVATVIQYLRDKGFSEQQRNYRTLHSDLPETQGSNTGMAISWSRRGQNG